MIFEGWYETDAYINTQQLSKKPRFFHSNFFSLNTHTGELKKHSWWKHDMISDPVARKPQSLVILPVNQELRQTAQQEILFLEGGDS